MFNHTFLSKHESKRELTKKSILFEFLAISIFCYALFYTLSFFEQGSMQTQMIVWFFNIVMISFILFRITYLNHSFSDFGLTFAELKKMSLLRVVLSTLVLFAAGIAAFLFGSVLASFFSEIPQEINTSQYNPLKGNLLYFVVSITLVGFASSFGEELIYRAYVIERLAQIFKTKLIAILISSLIFALAHFQWGFLGIIQTFFMGLVFAIGYTKFKGNIWINVVAHFYMDALLLFQLYNS